MKSYLPIDFSNKIWKGYWYSLKISFVKRTWKINSSGFRFWGASAKGKGFLFNRGIETLLAPNKTVEERENQKLNK